MIFDDLKNIGLYRIDRQIVDYILNLNSKIPSGRHEISDTAYINIEEYTTRDEIKLEAHKKYIDIQFLIEGEEKVYTTGTDGLEVCVPYNCEKDIAFYKTPERNLNVLYLTKNKFVILYPNDAHSPCMAIDGSKKVKKAIVKIKI